MAVEKFPVALNFSPVVQTLSPVTDLTNNLSSLSTLSSSNGTPRRRNSIDTFYLRTVPMLKGFDSDSDSSFNSPMMQERLLREMKVDNNSNRMRGQKIERRQPFKKRINKDVARSPSLSVGSSNSYDSGFSEAKSEISLFSSYSPAGSVNSPLQSIQETDDGFTTIFYDELDENSCMPSAFTNLLTMPLITHNTQVDCTVTSTDKENKLESANVENNDEVKLHQKQVDNLRSHSTSELQTSYKRPEPKGLFSPSTCKRRKNRCLRVISDPQNLTSSNKKSDVCNLTRSLSLNEAAIMNAVQRAMQEPDLIGDLSKTYALPLTEGKCEDLKAISPETVADLLQGHYNDVINSYSIVDCRYPYEYSAGHIKGAENIYTENDIYSKFLADHRVPVKSSERNIIVFHCEFSSIRGPKLCRYLRNEDRELNRNIYPYLHYPEVYLLSGGYKAFYQSYKELCEPPDYKPMLHKDHEKELRLFRAKSKSSFDRKRSVRSGLTF